MKERNITLTGILLLILVIIIGSSLAIAKSNLLGVGMLGLRNLSATLVSLHGDVDAVDNRATVAGLTDLLALNEVVLNVEADNLSGVELSVLHD